MRLEPNNIFQDAVISSGLRFIEVWYHFTDIRRLDGSEDTRLVQARPRYTVLSSSAAAAQPPGASLVHQTADFNIYLLPESLPYAFLATPETLAPQGGKGELLRSEVSEVSAFSPTPNRVEMIAGGQGGRSARAADHPLPRLAGARGWQSATIAQGERLPGGRRAAGRAPVHLRVQAEAVLHRIIDQPGLPGDHKRAAAQRPAARAGRSLGGVEEHPRTAARLRQAAGRQAPGGAGGGSSLPGRRAHPRSL